MFLLVLAACSGGGLSAVDREAQTEINPTVTLTGAIVVESTDLVSAEDTATVTLDFYFQPGGAVVESHRLRWLGEYRVLFFHDDVCDWSFSVTLWDGRRSETHPVYETPPQVCSGAVVGPTFWFP